MMNDTIDCYDRKTPLGELRTTLGWYTTQENLENLVMVLCQRVETLENRVARLESKSEVVRNDEN